MYVLRRRPWPFKFGWVWNTFCYANTSVFLPRLFVTWPLVGYALYGGALSSHQKGAYPSYLWFIETVNSQPRISTDSNKNKSNGEIRVNDIKCATYLLTFSSGKSDPWNRQKWPLKWVNVSVAALLFFYLHISWLKYRFIPLHKMYQSRFHLISPTKQWMSLLW